ncbi:MAG: sulfotransferase family protein [Steroidobacteraceae bacterium]|nr:sulfotransferase family protein [Steroidobacteraceae bacterium]
MQNERSSRLLSLVAKATRARAEGDLPAAVRYAEAAAKERLAHPTLLRIRAEALRDAGRLDAAGELLNRALKLAPHDAAIVIDIGRLLLAEDRGAEAIEVLTKATALAPASVEAWNALAAACAGEGRTTDARAAFRCAAHLAPNDPAPRADLAFLEARAGQTDVAAKLAAEALRLEPDHPVATLALARVEVDGREFEAARVRLEPLLARGVLKVRQRQIATHLLADALHGLGRADQAFELYGRMKQTFARRHARRFGTGGAVESHLAFLERLAGWFERQPADAWRKTAPASIGSPVREHVFLLGYLRSGVTLVETILASLPDVRVLEEGGTLATADLAFLKDDASLAHLEPLDQALADQARTAYWQRVREAVPDFEGKVFVDMSPLYGIKLPMIARLFPQARIVCCRRDPRDVVLSCYRRNFVANALTYQLTSVEGIARHYDAAMHLTERHLAALGLPVHVVGYEALVANFDERTRALAQFVGAEWTDAVRRFERTAAAREISTPSASQVRRGLFDGSGQWRAYRGQLEPVLPALAPWVEKFGYEPS